MNCKTEMARSCPQNFFFGHDFIITSLLSVCRIFQRLMRQMKTGCSWSFWKFHLASALRNRPSKVFEVHCASWTFGAGRSVFPVFHARPGAIEDWPFNDHVSQCTVTSLTNPCNFIVYLARWSDVFYYLPTQYVLQLYSLGAMCTWTCMFYLL